ncbi:hypothetical protein P154DRAFT_517576 [Amniculicola lignicola CBS 123094]|uniref:Carbohydrate-binding module family 1 protein n=1 Tax=Amniculicola lignicola CBS 123094 TaxID=1392246 RepID=A0A6A5X246_9PLEO|nr:hypothetical protein P154DRAFT_517576 [Amniculicola lignicola CBS 123094]
MLSCHLLTILAVIVTSHGQKHPRFVIPTSAPWAIPFPGPSSNPSTPWGLRRANGGFGYYKININSSDHVPEVPSVIDLEDGATPNVRLLATTDGNSGIVQLGPNSNLIAASSDAKDVRIPTVPFGINLGYHLHHNGTIIINGYYDSNRIKSTSWTPVPNSASSDVERTLLHNGTLEGFPCFGCPFLPGRLCVCGTKWTGLCCSGQ